MSMMGGFFVGQGTGHGESQHCALRAGARSISIAR